MERSDLNSVGIRLQTWQLRIFVCPTRRTQRQLHGGWLTTGGYILCLLMLGLAILRFHHLSKIFRCIVFNLSPDTASTSRPSQIMMEETCCVFQKMISSCWWVSHDDRKIRLIENCHRWVLWTELGLTMTCTGLLSDLPLLSDSPDPGWSSTHGSAAIL